MGCFSPRGNIWITILLTDCWTRVWRSPRWLVPNYRNPGSPPGEGHCVVQLTPARWRHLRVSPQPAQSIQWQTRQFSALTPCDTSHYTTPATTKLYGWSQSGPQGSATSWQPFWSQSSFRCCIKNRVTKMVARWAATIFIGWQSIADWFPTDRWPGMLPITCDQSVIS